MKGEKETYQYVIHWALLWTVLVVFCSMIHKWNYVWLGTMASLVYIPMFFFKRNKKWKLYYPLVVMGGEVVVTIVLYKRLLSGICFLINQVFHESAKAQSYIYHTYQVQESAVQNNINAMLSIGIIIVSCAAVGLLVLRWNERIMGVLSFILIALFSAYFGVEVRFGAMVLFVIVDYTVFVRCTIWKEMVKYAIVILVVATAVHIFVPENIHRISELDENLRDELALHTVYFEGEQTVDSEKNKYEEKQQQEEKKREDSNHFFYKKELKLNYRGVLTIILILLTLMMFIMAFLADRRRKLSEKHRMGMDSEDVATAIHVTYLYAMKWVDSIGAYGILQEEQQYEVLREIWLEATYSGHKMKSEELSKMRDFLIDIEKKVWEKASRRERFRIRYDLGLVMEKEITNMKNI